MPIDTSHPTFKAMARLLTSDEYMAVTETRGWRIVSETVFPVVPAPPDGTWKHIARAADLLGCTPRKVVELEARAGERLEAAGLDLRDFIIPQPQTPTTVGVE